MAAWPLSSHRPSYKSYKSNFRQVKSSHVDHVAKSSQVM